MSKDKKQENENMNVGEEPPRFTLLSDHPILGERSIKPPDALDLHERLRVPLDILRHEKTQTPYTIAFYGDWGTGKTSSMRWVDKQLTIWNDKKTDRGEHPTVTPVWFFP